MDANVLRTGASGYAGGRLLRQFEEGGRTVRCLARQPAGLSRRTATAEVVAVDSLDEMSQHR